MIIVDLRPEQIALGERLRPVDAEHVAWLATSIQRIGLQAPITVGRAGADGMHPLRAGARRLTAVRQLGLPTITAIISEATDTAARLIEIDENLVRHDLTPLDRGAFLAARKELWEALHPETKRGTLGAAKRWQKECTEIMQRHGGAVAFTKATAEKLGIAPRTVRQMLQIASLSADVRRLLAGTVHARSTTTLRQLSARPPEERLALAQALVREWQPVRTVGECGPAVMMDAVVVTAGRSERA